MNFKLPFPEIYPIIHEVIKPDTHVYLVGGCVRDLLLNREPQDIDIVLSAEVKAVSRKLANVLNGAVFSLDDERDTMRVFIERAEKKWKLDIALLRGNNLEKDLQTRDFCVNAMALEIKPDLSYEFTDILDGYQDLQAKQIRLCSDSSIADDPIRILRAIRLALSLDFSLTASTKSKIQQGVSLLHTVSAERKRDELFKLLTLEKSSAGLAALASLDVLSYLFPAAAQIDFLTEQSLAKLLTDAGLQQKTPVISENFGSPLHTYLQTSMVEERTITALLKVAALYQGGDNPLACIQDFCSTFVLSNRECDFLLKVIGGINSLHTFVFENEAVDPKAIYRFYQSTENAGVGSCLVVLARMIPAHDDMVFSHAVSVCSTLLDAYFNQHEKFISLTPILNGDDLIKHFKLSPGPQFKVLLEALKEAQVSGEVKGWEQAKQFIQSALNRMKC